MNRLFPIALVAIALTPTLAPGMGSDHKPGELPAHNGWPTGVHDAVNQPNRVHGYWVNSSDTLFYQGSHAEFHKMIHELAAISELNVIVVLHAGSGVAKSPWSKEPVSKADYAVTIRGDEAISRIQDDAIVRVWLGGQLSLADLAIPASVKVLANPASVEVESDGEIDKFIQEHDAIGGANPEPGLKRSGEQSGLRASEFGIRLTLLEYDEVREELRLSSRTMMRVAELRKQLQQELSEAFDKRDEAVARGASPGILELFLREANERKRAELKELLTDGQGERLRQLVLQFLGIRALHDEDVAGVLGLTADQRTQLAELQAQFERGLTPIVEKLMNEQFDGEADWRREFRRHALSLYAEYIPRYRKVLTEAQREQFRRMQGKPLTFPDRPPQLED